MQELIFTDPEPGYEPEFLGRNGFAKMSGLNMYHAKGRNIQICPIRTKGIEGKAMISVPVRDIPAMIVALQTLYDQHTHT